MSLNSVLDELRVHSEEYIFTKVGYKQWDVSNTNDGTVKRLIDDDVRALQFQLYERGGYRLMRTEDSGDFVVWGRVWMLDPTTLTATQQVS